MEPLDTTAAETNVNSEDYTTTLIPYLAASEFREDWTVVLLLGE